MSGFFAIARQDGNPVSDQLLQSVSAQLASRGPDGTHIWKHHEVSVRRIVAHTDGTKLAALCDRIFEDSAAVLSAS
jgi:asparagine synthetase B (glutamine-hydrolysing)